MRLGRGGGGVMGGEEGRSVVSGVKSILARLKTAVNPPVGPWKTNRGIRGVPNRVGRNCRAGVSAFRFAMLELPRAMRTRLFWCITLYLLCHPRLGAQTVTTQLPPVQNPPSATLPDDPSLHSSIPELHVVPQPSAGVPVKIVANTQSREETKSGIVYTLDDNVVLYYRRYIVHADHVSYNATTGDVVAQGHLMVDGGPDDEHFEASHGTINVEQDTGDFFDVVGTLGVERRPRGQNGVHRPESLCHYRS